MNKYAMILATVLMMALVACSKEDGKSFAKVDYNKDGKINFEELIVVFPDLTVEEFLAADSDRNGTLDEKEYQRFRDARQAGKKLSAADAAPAKPADESPAKRPEAPAPAPTAAPTQPAAQSAAPAQPAAPAPIPDQKASAPTEAPTPPAAQATPAKPAAPATPAEPVETVVSEKATPAEPAKEADKETYVVQRGDNLYRIAKKFGVEVKAILAANNLQNADRVDAGVTLVIPAKGGSDAGTGTAASVPPAVNAFVSDYLAKIAGNDVNALLDLYADKVTYYRKGEASRDIVRQDKADYFARWPERSYKPGQVAVKALPGKDGRIVVTVPVAYMVKKADKTTSGKAVFTLTLVPAGDAYRIAGESSAVVKAK